MKLVSATKQFSCEIQWNCFQNNIKTFSMAVVCFSHLIVWYVCCCDYYYYYYYHYIMFLHAARCEMLSNSNRSFAFEMFQIYSKSVYSREWVIALRRVDIPEKKTRTSFHIKNCSLIFRCEACAVCWHLFNFISFYFANKTPDSNTMCWQWVLRTKLAFCSWA